MKKTYKKWEKSNSKDLDEYLGNIPCEIDEELFLYLAEITASQYSSENFIQTGEATFEKDDVYHYSTCSHFNDKFYYLGILPEFKQ